MNDPINNSAAGSALLLGYLMATLKFILQILPAAVGSMISLRFLPEGLSRAKIFTAWLSAWGIGTFVGRGVASFLDITNHHVSDALMFGFALFGLSLAGAILNEIPVAIRVIRERFLGKSSVNKISESDGDKDHV